MNTVRRIIFALIVTSLYVATARADEVDDYLKAAMARQHIASLSVVVIRDGHVMKSKGYGLASLELRVPAKPKTVYELASATKPFIASAIMLLVQDGKLHLDDKVAQYVDGLPADWNGITLRHLLSSGRGAGDFDNHLALS